MLARAGRAPVRLASRRWSTTARIATPVRVPKSRSRKPTATATAVPMAMISCQLTNTGPRSTPSGAKKPSTLRPSGGQMLKARPISTSVRPMVTTRLDTSDAAAEVTGQSALDEHAEQRRDDHQYRDEGYRRRPAPVEAELPVDEGHQHADGPVGEVEHAGGRVGDNEPAGRDRVDGAGDDAHDRERDQLVHMTTVIRPCTGRGRRPSSGTPPRGTRARTRPRPHGRGGSRPPPAPARRCRGPG